ncbi:MAG: pyridoxal 5'-phosphate synthase glutaminase subunit PdxT [Chloroflexaceae bacterium]|nr:pyridoxal 5'-phosphate synthase glutaminase subunit PdxT [Chloroflexaceae bacterium]
MTVGILALQGDFREHAEALQRLGVTSRLVRLPQHLEGLERLIIPGGESTTIGKLMVTYNLLEPLQQRANEHLAIWGTCAGAILMARQIDNAYRDQPRLGIMDIRIRRNTFGRQIDSFEAHIDLPLLGAEPLKGVFIRAPGIESAGPNVEVLGRLSSDGTIVAARQQRLLVTTFHPELAGDDRLHRYFLTL